MKKRCVILHQQVSDQAAADEQDVLLQAAFIAEALNELQYETQTLALGLNLEEAEKNLKALNPGVVFNLVESVHEEGQWIYFATALLEKLNLPYTGCPHESVFLTSNKLAAKKFMKALNIHTPPWQSLRAEDENRIQPDRKAIIKAVWEHASIGISEDSVIQTQNPETVLERIKSQSEKAGKEFFAEEFIAGREFNIAVLAGEVLPIPEIVFEGYEENRLKIVDYRAKWDESSYEYHHTPRKFSFAEEDRPLLKELERITLQCWKAFELSGYARVDFRVDEQNRPFVLEINTNPCLSPDSGFYAALNQAGISMKQAAEKILLDAQKRRRF